MQGYETIISNVIIAIGQKKKKKIRTLNDGKFKTNYAESLKIYLLCLTIKTIRFK